MQRIVSPNPSPAGRQHLATANIAVSTWPVPLRFKVDRDTAAPSAGSSCLRAGKPPIGLWQAGSSRAARAWRGVRIGSWPGGYSHPGLLPVLTVIARPDPAPAAICRPPGRRHAPRPRSPVRRRSASSAPASGPSGDLPAGRQRDGDLLAGLRAGVRHARAGSPDTGQPRFQQAVADRRSGERRARSVARGLRPGRPIPGHDVGVERAAVGSPSGERRGQAGAGCYALW
jgi:hypothetical protein